MRSEKYVQNMLKQAKQQLKETLKRFMKHDNHEDMVECDMLQREIEVLKKVLRYDDEA